MRTTSIFLAVLISYLVSLAAGQRGNRLGWAPEEDNSITPDPNDIEGENGGGTDGNEPAGPEGPKRERIPEAGSVSHAPLGRIPNRATSTMAPEVVGPAFSCRGKKNGYYADTTNCEKFHYCFWDRDFVKSCPPGSAWNGKIQRCDWKYNVQCSADSSSGGGGAGSNVITRRPTTKRTTPKPTKMPNVISTVRYPSSNNNNWNSGRWNPAWNNNWNNWNNYITSTKTPVPSENFSGKCPATGKFTFVEPRGCHKVSYTIRRTMLKNNITKSIATKCDKYVLRLANPQAANRPAGG
jgi:hypothetical protein